MKLRMALGTARDCAGDAPVDGPALTIEGDESGLRHLISLLEHVVRVPAASGYHAHLVHGDQPGICLNPEQLLVTIRRIE